VTSSEGYITVNQSRPFSDSHVPLDDALVIVGTTLFHLGRTEPNRGGVLFATSDLNLR